MDWTSSFINAINYIEEHLLDDLSIEEVAKCVSISPFYFQKAFVIYTGYSVSEYIRFRRLYQSALDIRLDNKNNIIDIAYKYGYETPEAFTKAFTRFHGITPSKARIRTTPIKIFLPLHISINIVGGDKMDYSIEKLGKLKFVGFLKEISANEGYIECPKFWDEVSEKYFCDFKKDNLIGELLRKYNIGEYAICYDGDGKTFKYMIGGLFNDVCDNLPNCLTVIELDESLWAKFKCFGPLPGALQSVNTKIWEDWIPNNPEYELNFNADIEWHSSGNIEENNYESAIWLPIKKKN